MTSGGLGASLGMLRRNPTQPGIKDPAEEGAQKSRADPLW